MRWLFLVAILCIAVVHQPWEGQCPAQQHPDLCKTRILCGLLLWICIHYSGDIHLHRIRNMICSLGNNQASRHVVKFAYVILTLPAEWWVRITHIGPSFELKCWDIYRKSHWATLRRILLTLLACVALCNSHVITEGWSPSTRSGAWEYSSTLSRRAHAAYATDAANSEACLSPPAAWKICY